MLTEKLKLLSDYAGVLNPKPMSKQIPCCILHYINTLLQHSAACIHTGQEIYRRREGLPGSSDR